VYKARATTGNYHAQMNFNNFGKWVAEKIVCNLPPIHHYYITVRNVTNLLQEEEENRKW
jgi:hypothetical protein